MFCLSPDENDDKSDIRQNLPIHQRTPLGSDWIDGQFETLGGIAQAKAFASLPTAVSLA